MCLLREAIFVTAGEKQVGSCAPYLISCFKGTKKQVSSQGIFYVDGNCYILQDL